MSKTVVSSGWYEMPAASLGEENRLPDIYVSGLGEVPVEPTNLPEEDTVNLGKGYTETLLPYNLQDGYDRIKKMRKFISVTMENDSLKAVILPEVGGRIWSLYDKKRKKEMVFKNPVFQPSNFALRNAWTAGGIEYNVGMRGHNFLTSSKIYCAINQYTDGRKTVKLWEYERIRNVVYSVELYLPDDRDCLMARITIENTSDKDTYTYWWTNIAIEETPDTRVLTPATRSYRTNYEAGKLCLELYDFVQNKTDGATWPYRNVRSQDYFYKIDKSSEKWIVSADKDGDGLAFVSTDFLKGRKLFVWGTGSGGRNWNEFLSKKGLAYSEIQGGLADHQFDHIPMPAKSTWQWVEAYAPFSGDTTLLHAENPIIAQKEAFRNLTVSGEMIERENLFGDLTEKTLLETQYVTLGSGWGYVENRIREKTGGEPVSTQCSFPASAVTRAEQDWLYLINNGQFPFEDVTFPPESNMTGDYIIQILKHVAETGDAGAYTYLQLGTALFAAGQLSDAYESWEKSYQITPNAWAARNIAMLKRHEGDLDAAYQYMRKSMEIQNLYRPVLIDCARIYYEAGRFEEWLNLYKNLPEKFKSVGRIRYYAVMAYIGCKKFEEAESLIGSGFIIDDLREGEQSLNQMWQQLYEIRGIPVPPIPKCMDFRMNEG